MYQLSHEKLEVYQFSIRFLALATRLIDSIQRGNGALVDQLKRASLSIVLNIAEGAGYPSVAKRKNHYSIARGSALECGSVLDACKILRVGDQNMLPEGKKLLYSIVSMLSKMSR
jgi:four helix bundle protein